MVILNALPEATFTNYLMLNIEKLTLFRAIIGYTKAAAAILVIMDLFLKYFKITEIKNPFKAEDFIRPLVLVTVICTYDILMSTVDYGITAGDLYIANNLGSWDNFKSSLPPIPSGAADTAIYSPTPALSKTTTDPSAMGTMVEQLNEINTYIAHPTKILTVIFEYIGNFFSSLIYSSALLIRAFGLFFLKVTGPLFIILSLFSYFKNAMWQWLRYYIIFTVWIIPFYLVNIFFEYVYAESRSMCTYMGVSSVMYGVTISMIAIFVKFTVAKGSFSWLEKIIVISPGASSQ